VIRDLTEEWKMTERGEWQSIEDYDMFQALEKLSDEVWDATLAWRPYAQNTVGQQLVRAVDSVGANLVEGDGRYHHREKLNFFYIARGSVKEARYWVRRARIRRLLPEEQAKALERQLEATRRWINTLISQRRKWLGEVREEGPDYTV
jgi:four helix bundle protein